MISPQILKKIKERATALNIPFKDIKESNRSGKKLMIEIQTADGTGTIHFGAKGSQTFVEGASKAKRDAYRARHSKIMLAGQPAYQVRYSPAFLSWNLLWS